MAINKLTALNPTTPTETGNDWNNLIELLNSNARVINGMQFIVDASVIKQGSYIQHGGVIYRVEDEDYTILGTFTSGVFNYIKVEASGDNLIATWVTDISAYSWNNIYSCLLHSSDESQILPVTRRDSLVYRLEQKLVNYRTGQNLRTSDDVEFNSLNVKSDIYIKGNKGYFLPLDIIKNSFSAPSTAIIDLTFDGTNLISCDSNDTIYVHDGVSSNILTSFSAPSTAISGLTFDGTNLISCDSVTDNIYIHDGVSSTILSSFSAALSAPYGLAFDGTNLISGYISNGTKYIHDGVSSTILDTLSLDFRGKMTYTGNNLIVADISSSFVKIYIGLTNKLIDSFDSLGSGAGAGLAFDGTNLIICDSETDSIYENYSEYKIYV